MAPLTRGTFTDIAEIHRFYQNLIEFNKKKMKTTLLLGRSQKHRLGGGWRISRGGSQFLHNFQRGGAKILHKFRRGGSNILRGTSRGGSNILRGTSRGGV